MSEQEVTMQKPMFTVYRLPLVQAFLLPGVIYDCRTIKPGVPFAVTGENPDLYFPDGIYRCISDMYWGGDGPGGKEDYPTYKILVPGRDQIKFHKLNDPKTQSLGCPGIAEFFGETLGRTVIGDSKGGFMEFMARAKDCNEFFTEFITAFSHDPIPDR